MRIIYKFILTLSFLFLLIFLSFNTYAQSEDIADGDNTDNTNTDISSTQETIDNPEFQQVEPISEDNKLLYLKYLDDIQQEYSLKNMNSYNLGGTTSNNTRNLSCDYEKENKGDLNQLMDAVENAEEGGLLCGRSFVLTAALQLQYDIEKNCGASPSELAEIEENLEKASKASLEPYCIHKAQTNRLGESDDLGSGFSMVDAIDLAVGVFAIRESLEGRDGIALYQAYLNAKNPPTAEDDEDDEPPPTSSRRECYLTGEVGEILCGPNGRLVRCVFDETLEVNYWAENVFGPDSFCDTPAHQTLVYGCIPWGTAENNTNEKCMDGRIHVCEKYLSPNTMTHWEPTSRECSN